MQQHHANMEWSIDLRSCCFSVKQIQYKAGKELEKDGDKSNIFFYLATPKQEHYMAHTLALAGPAGKICQVYPETVDEDGQALKGIVLLHYSESHDRFVSIKELAYFELQTGEQQLVKIRIETPSKCNMGKAFQVRYQVRIRDACSSSSELVVCQSPPTDPVYVQTKRGGTTAVVHSPISTPSSSKGSSRQSTASSSRSSSSGVTSRGGRGSVSELDARRLGKRDSPSGNSSEAFLAVASKANVTSAGRSSKKRPRGSLGAGASGARGIAAVTAAGIGAQLFERRNSESSADFGGSNEGRTLRRSRSRDRGNDLSEAYESLAESQTTTHNLLESLNALHRKVDALSSLLIATSNHVLSQVPHDSAQNPKNAHLRQLLATVEALPGDADYGNDNACVGTRNSGGLDRAENGHGGNSDIYDDDIESGTDEDGADGDQGDNREKGEGVKGKGKNVRSPSIIRYTSLGPVGVKDLKAADVRAGVTSLTTLRGSHGSSRHVSGSGNGQDSRDNGISNLGLPHTSRSSINGSEVKSYSHSDVQQPIPDSVPSAQCSTAVLTASQDDMSDAFLLTSMSQGSGISQSFGAEVSLSQDSVLQPSQE